MNAANEQKTIDILGIEYEVHGKRYGEEDTDGETDFFSKKIFLREDNVNGISDFLELQKNNFKT